MRRARCGGKPQTKPLQEGRRASRTRGARRLFSNQSIPWPVPCSKGKTRTIAREKEGEGGKGVTRVCCGRKQRAGEPRRRRSSTPASSCPRSRAPPPRPAAHRQASSITRARKNLRNRNKTGDTRARRRAAGALSGRSPSLYPPPRTQNTPSTSLACSAEAGTSSTEPAGRCAVSQGPPGGGRAMAARAPDRVAEDLAARGRVERHLERERIHEERRRAPLPRRLCALEERTNLAHCRHSRAACLRPLSRVELAIARRQTCSDFRLASAEIHDRTGHPLQW